jgi:hypothetical protein
MTFTPAPSTTGCLSLIGATARSRLLAIGALIVGHAFRTGSHVVPLPLTAVLPTHSSPAIAEGEVDEGDAGQTPRGRAAQKTGPRNELKRRATRERTGHGFDGGGVARGSWLCVRQKKAPRFGGPRITGADAKPTALGSNVTKHDAAL